MAKKDLSIILPCYNEGATFDKSVPKIVSVLSKLHLAFEIIFVEDKSGDDTAKKVKKFVDSISQAKAIYHTRNQGRGRAVKDGIGAARGEICGFLDVDLEVAADYIPLFVEEIKNGADFAVGKRFYEGEGIKTFPRWLASRTYALAVKFLLNVPLEDTEAGYKFFRRSKILPVVAKVRDNHWFFDTEICARVSYAGLKISQVPVLFIRKVEKRSTVRLIPDTLHYIKSIFKFRSQVAKYASRNS